MKHEHPSKKKIILEKTRRYSASSNVSETIPDAALTVKEMLERHAKGLNINSGKVELWEGEEDSMPDLSRYDKADRQMIMQDYALQLEEKRQKMINDIKDYNIKKHQERIDAEKRQQSRTEDIQHENVPNNKAIQQHYQKNIKSGKNKPSENEE